MKPPTFKEIQLQLNGGKTCCINLVNQYIKNIENSKHLNAFNEVFQEEALQQAEEIDLKIKKGTAKKLAGMVIAIKDNISYKDHHTEASSNMLKGFKPLFTATALQRLIDEDAIIIGRLNCDEFAMGGSNEFSAYGRVKNPFNNDFVSGGSSGGSAVAVAAGLCHAALGSDTGGSVRQPASFCGVTGLKPSYGRISRNGLIAFASGFDTIGTITNSTEDAALLLQIMSGSDEYDSTSSKKQAPAYYDLLASKKQYRIAILNEAINAEGLDGEVKQKINSLQNTLIKKGNAVDVVHFDLIEQMIPCYYILTTAEASSNLARYSGMHFGHRAETTKSLDETLTVSRSEGFGKEVKRRMLLGSFVLSAGYYDAYYEKAQRIRRKIMDETALIFEQYDVILSPVSPSTAFKAGEKKDPVAMYLEDIFTVHANITGMPAISIPLTVHSNGLPYGIQLMAKAFDEVTLLQCSQYIEEIITARDVG